MLFALICVICTVNVWTPTWFGIQTAGLVPFPDNSEFGFCLKSALENPEPNAVFSYKSIQTGPIGLNDQKVAWNLNSLSFGFQCGLDFGR